MLFVLVLKALQIPPLQIQIFLLLFQYDPLFVFLFLFHQLERLVLLEYLLIQPPRQYHLKQHLGANSPLQSYPENLIPLYLERHFDVQMQAQDEPDAGLSSQVEDLFLLAPRHVEVFLVR